MISEADLLRLARAVEVAKTSQHRFRVGAVIFKHGNYLAAAPNKSRNDPSITPFQQCSVHAEMAALRRVVDAKRATVYVARVTKDNATAIARPCDRCAIDLAQAGVGRVVWTTDSVAQAARLSTFIEIKESL